MSQSGTSLTRRKFFDLAASAAGVAAASRRTAAQGPRGANDKVRIGLIGSGSRGRSVAALFVRNHPDVQYVANCDAYAMRLDQGIQQLSDLQKDVEARWLRRLPAHSRSQGCGCRSYRDAGSLALSDADRCHRRRQGRLSSRSRCRTRSSVPSRPSAPIRAPTGSCSSARSSAPARTSRKPRRSSRTASSERSLMRSFQFGGTGYGTPPEPEAPVPRGLNWDLFQGPAPKHPFKQGRLRWRGWWDYGGGLITDWGVHLTDVALWYLNSQRVGPLLTSGTAQYVNFVNPERDQSPDAFSVSWQYPGLRDDVHECRGPGLGVRASGKLLLRSRRQPADPSCRLRSEAGRRSRWPRPRRRGRGGAAPADAEPDGAAPSADSAARRSSRGASPGARATGRTATAPRSPTAGTSSTV